LILKNIIPSTEKNECWKILKMLPKDSLRERKVHLFETKKKNPENSYVSTATQIV